ncbi:NhaD sodium:hydrogen antiporter family sodium transporter [Prevotella sp. MGM2]|nr:NhaD sodium:hydrogen antiporter family sodium transporter [Prevotella sp. MGM2]
MCAQPFLDKVEAAVIVEHFHNGHCAQNEKYYLGGVYDVFKKNGFGNERFDGKVIDRVVGQERKEVYLMLGYNEISAVAYI